MECLEQCLGSWTPLLVIGGFFVFAAIVDAVPEMWAPGGFPLGRVLHALAGNVVRALRRARGGEKLPIELPKVVILIALSGAMSACTSAGGMLRVQAELWRGGGVAHLARSRPPTPPSDATAEEIATWTDWRHALEVAASTVCTEDQRQKVRDSSACRCAEGDLYAAACADFLAGKP